MTSDARAPLTGEPSAPGKSLLRQGFSRCQGPVAPETRNIPAGHPFYSAVRHARAAHGSRDGTSMKRDHGLLVAVLGAAAVSCGSSPGGTALAVHAPGHQTVAAASASPSSTDSTTYTLTIDGTSRAAAGATATSTASQPGGAPGEPVATAPASGDATAPEGPPSTPGRTPVTSGGWTLLAVFTAVESYHLDGDAEQVRGCALGAAHTCRNGTSDLGTYPGDFVTAVEEEGTGRITKGIYAGSYLVWDSVKGFSLDTMPLDDNGTPLRAFVSAAADDGITLMTHIRVLDCGVDTSTLEPLPPSVCTRFSSPDWVVVDRSGDAAGSHSLSLYVSEEDRPDFVTSYVTTTVSARVTLR
ncbi:MAG: hypothetical protein JWM18_1113 [Chloroflexi bacterium]|jgi:hypothetical protein|nr:hypothetical protein [Chloroflexota bacterium]MEA2500218.1 hypothetical protein [Actinomycetota bacterium]